MKSAVPQNRVLLDVMSLFFRAYHALPFMSTVSGEPTAALYGFCTLVLKLLREKHPAELALALDTPTPTFRHVQFAGYKATRAPVPKNLGSQLERLPILIEALGVPSFRAPGYEADDVLATLVRELAQEPDPIWIVSGDRDLFQLARGATRILFVGRRAAKPEVYDEDAVVRRFGVTPNVLPSWRALVGDPSDNLPGAPGIGPQRATKLLVRYGNVTKLLRHLDEVEPPSVQQTLREHSLRIAQNFELSRLVEDIPLAPGARHAPLTKEARSNLRSLFVAWEFASLLTRLDALPETI